MSESAGDEAKLDWLAALASSQAVLLEGLEVVFIVIALSAGPGLLSFLRVLVHLQHVCWSLVWALPCIVRWHGFQKTRSNLLSA